MGNKHFEKGGEPDEELKTLNDFHHGEYCPQCKLSIPIFDVEGLRTEAIKWIQEDIEEGDKNDVADLIIKWQKRFNLIIDEASNITEGDLK